MPPGNSASTPKGIIIEPVSWSVRLTGRMFVPLATLLCVASFLAFYFIFWTTWRTTMSGIGDLSTAKVEQALVEGQWRLATLKKHADQLAAIPQSDLDRIEIALPDGPAIPELLIELEALTRESGMIDPTFAIEQPPVTE